MTDAERAVWRGRALAWLRSDLRAWEVQVAEWSMTGEALTRNWNARNALVPRLSDPALEPVRNPSLRAALPAEEREEWAALFAETAVFLASMP